MNTLLPILNSLPEVRQEPVDAAATLRLDRRTYDRALACTQCGLCLPVCPTYLQTGLESENPRGRIQLMRGLSDGAIAPTRKIRQHLDSCLNCRACEQACPSGVVYHELIEETRDRLAKYQLQNPSPFASGQPLLRWFIQNVLVHPQRLKTVVLVVRALQRIGLYDYLQRLRLLSLLPPALQKMEQMLPETGPLWPAPLPPFTGDKGMDAVLVALHNAALLGQNGEARCRFTVNRQTPRKTVGFFAGCVGSIVCDGVNRQAIELLAACGADVYAPPQQGCCGAIHQGGGAMETAREMARKNIDLFLPRDGRAVDFIVTNVAGCATTLREYDVLLRDDPMYSAPAGEFSRRVRDITQMLDELPLPKMSHPLNLTAAYHQPCRLAQGRKNAGGIRKLLEQIPGLELRPLPDSDLCCGGAGTYNLTQPRMAADLADHKLDIIAAAKADVLISANIGCALHLQARAKLRGQGLRIVHPVELIHQAVFGPAWAGGEPENPIGFIPPMPKTTRYCA